MARSYSANGKRLGRPPATDSAESQRRILDMARTAFATGGYDSSTNLDLTGHVGITAGALEDHAAHRDDFFVQSVGVGVANGEIPKRNRLFMIEFVRTILIGLTDGVSDNTTRHKRAITSIKLALRGDLMTPQGRLLSPRLVTAPSWCPRELTNW
jgi:AcrR family transcriptional regulator